MKKHGLKIIAGLNSQSGDAAGTTATPSLEPKDKGDWNDWEKSNNRAVERIFFNQMQENKRLSIMPPVAGKSYPEHNCWNYTQAHYLIGSEGTAKKCGTCDKILEFRYRSFWKRLWRVFINF